MDLVSSENDDCTIEDWDTFDLNDAFRYYNDLCFDGALEAVVVGWSNRLTLCAGKCYHRGRGFCEIRLSEPLLRYRSANECKETLLHEMIHAYLFAKNKSKRHAGHGKDFIWHMNRINEITGLNVTIHHNFRREVEYHRRHVWRCSGACRNLPPAFGYIRRSRNIIPGPRDKWWNHHAQICAGTFVKVDEAGMHALVDLEHLIIEHSRSKFNDESLASMEPVEIEYSFD
ncbi:bifunctional SprT-like domain-containing protein Spartan/SprT-like [Babesia duncani]|uniref:Bifunctional SprT-like domain-containing protein Spartan/SprT-like n=1 Tax=Babesia duncani TaxID=323732 RepID=A0AAD9PP44_9APIC|nr:bifunctional SprT-like domain-containing protein Spartan/SprT-like [Babesia duncani]